MAREREVDVREQVERAGAFVKIGPVLGHDIQLSPYNIEPILVSIYHPPRQYAQVNSPDEGSRRRNKSEWW